MKILTFTTICIFVMLSTSYASWFDGNDLKEWCASDISYDRGLCLGFVAAAASKAFEQDYCEVRLNNGKTIYRYLGALYDECEDPQEIAMPSKIKLKQMIDIAIKYLNDNPERLHETATSLVTSAMIVAFGWRSIKE